MTPHQSPQQKQLKITDLEVQSATPVPVEDEPTTDTSNWVSSQVSHAQMPEQELLKEH